MDVDESFRKAGAVPFKWEIRPGVPKIQQQQQHHHQRQRLQKQTSQPLSSPPFEFDHHRHSSSSPAPPQKLRPPPGGFQFFPPVEPRSQSFRSTPRARSDRWRFDQPTRLRPDCVSPGCFPAPLLRRKESKDSKRRVRVNKPESEPGYFSDLETLGRWSVSSRRSLSPFTGSPASSSFSSYKSSPRPMGDAEWAGFGLF